MEHAERRPTSGPPWAWRLAVRCVMGLLRGLFGWRILARRPDVVPRPDQPLLVVINHTSNIDAFLVADTLWRRMRQWVQPLVKVELFEIPVIGAVIRQTGAIPVVRGEGGGREAAYDAAVARLRAGGTILIAPEGTVTHDGSLLPMRHGAARLALEAGVDVLVVTHFGAQRAFSPLARMPERDVVVTMVTDVVTPWSDEDEKSLTGRIAAIMLDRSAELQANYPQADPTAPWWPPYSAPASPSVTARENLERYRESMSEAVAHARERMARIAEDHEVEQRVADARERARAAAEDIAVRSRARAEELTEQARHRMEELTEQARERAPHFGHHPDDSGTARPGRSQPGPERPDDTGAP